MSEQLRIGGTMAANIVGHGFKSPYEAWAILTGKVQPENLDDIERVEAGTFMEPAAAAWFRKRTGIAVVDSPGLMVDKEFPWLAGSPDRLLLLPSGKPGVLECKNTHGFAAKDWKQADSEAITAPLGYQVQLQTYLRITGFEVGYFAAIVGGNHLETPRMDRDDVFLAWLMEQLLNFIEHHVKADVPPPTSADDLDVLKRMWPKDCGRTITAGPKDNASIALLELIDFKRQIKALELHKDACEAVIKAAMQDATTLVTPNARATWKSQVAQHKARPARTVESRVLRTGEDE